MRKGTISTVRSLIHDLKIEALHAGRYSIPHKAENWEQRDKSEAFTCIAYRTAVRRINALEDMIGELRRLGIGAGTVGDLGKKKAKQASTQQE